MKGNIKQMLLCFAGLYLSLGASAKTWTLDECIRYAMDNNITLQKAGLSRQSSEESVLSAKAALLPSLSFSTSHNVGYQPWKEIGTATVQNGQVETSTTHTSYNGSYTLGANWTVWDGNRNRNTILENKNLLQQAEQDSIAQSLNIEEQIAQLYIQILYSKEAIEVNKATLEAAKVNEDRAKQMLNVGNISKAECSQFTAERAQDEYSVVQAESNVRNYKRQLKALLQITDSEDFDVVSPQATDAMALQPIPSQQVVYETALMNRPELRQAQLAVDNANIQKQIAKSGHMPTVSLNASIGTNTSSLSNNAWGEQMKSNFNAGAGISVSVPIFDQRSTKTAVTKANLAYQQAQLDVRDRQTSLYSTIENYWIQANNNQSQYKAAKVSTEAAQESYDLLSEQFAVGLKNIVELQEGKTRLLSAQQSELQSKYMTILNIKMLELYAR
jgi:outer membrane protein